MLIETLYYIIIVQQKSYRVAKSQERPVWHNSEKVDLIFQLFNLSIIKGSQEFC